MIKRKISLVLGLMVISGSVASVFAGKGDPLLDHPEYAVELREKCQRMWDSTRDPKCSIKWEKEPKFTLGFSDDYRTVRIYNIPHLLDCTIPAEGDRSLEGFLMTYAKALIDAQKSLEKTKKRETISKESAAKYFTSEVTRICKEEGYDKGIAKFLGTDDVTAVNSFIGSMILSSDSRCLGAAVGTSAVALNAFNVLQPIFLPSLVVAPPVAITVTVAHNLLNIARIATTSREFNAERVANNAVALSLVNQIFLNRPEDVMNSNVLVTAVDDRPFYSAFLWNSFPGRRNDGAWARFREIGDLKCCPLAKDYKGGAVVAKYIDIFRGITQGGNLNLEILEKVLNGENLTLQVSSDQQTEKSGAIQDSSAKQGK